VCTEARLKGVEARRAVKHSPISPISRDVTFTLPLPSPTISTCQLQGLRRSVPV
jgi:hypothetical protein